MLKALDNCRICPRNCGVNRNHTAGYCRSGTALRINTWQKHYGEEPFISGTAGSGTIFFSGCNLSCCFCQNYQISQLDHGKDYSIDQLAEIMLSLQQDGAHNINLVTPTHFSPQIAEALLLARKLDLHIPVVWNSNAYEKEETLKSLKGLINIYLADFKYASEASALKYSAAPDYFRHATNAISEMYRQTGDIALDANDIALSGLAVRILVLPRDIINLENIIKWLAENIGNQLYISLMSQYYPSWQAEHFPETARSLTFDEYEEAISIVKKYGFENCLIQELSPSSEWTPDFKIVEET
ncbi:MAG: radical SAM protein [Candidatus Cloacimonetes bacterium]|nr:radical SAM protein [Candidatus Cloacimonadota bacterium]